MDNLIHEMADLFNKDEGFVLATVVTRNGSAPRSAGARMLVRSGGSTCGTVGGGRLEAMVEELAGKVMQDHRAVMQDFEFNGADASQMDMICGGQVNVFVEWWNPSDATLRHIIKDLVDSDTLHRKSWIVTVLPGEKTMASHALLYRSGPGEKIVGNIPDQIDLTFVRKILKPGLVEVGQSKVMVEPVNISGSVLIFGAGHVSRCLAEFTKSVGFWTVVLDDRPEYANQQRFPSADEIFVLDSFSAAFEKTTIDADSYIVIVTRGHLCDQIVLNQALKTQAGYIGMIGSRRKRELIFDDLLQKGFTAEDIQRVHSPIGLPIEAETPEEIGISITAELIQIRAEKLKLA